MRDIDNRPVVVHEPANECGGSPARVAAAAAARRQIGDETAAARLTVRGWLCIPPAGVEALRAAIEAGTPVDRLLHRVAGQLTELITKGN